MQKYDVATVQSNDAGVCVNLHMFDYVNAETFPQVLASSALKDVVWSKVTQVCITDCDDTVVFSVLDVLERENAFPNLLLFRCNCMESNTFEGVSWGEMTRLQQLLLGGSNFTEDGVDGAVNIIEHLYHSFPPELRRLSMGRFSFRGASKEEVEELRTLNRDLYQKFKYPEESHYVHPGVKRVGVIRHTQLT